MINKWLYNTSIIPNLFKIYIIENVKKRNKSSPSKSSVQSHPKEKCILLPHPICP